MTASLPINYGTDIFLHNIPQTASHCVRLLLLGMLTLTDTVHILYALTQAHGHHTFIFIHSNITKSVVHDFS